MALTVQIKKRYGDFLLDVDFTAHTGRMLALLGASGCGKSVTLKCVAGIQRPDEGRIELDGRVLFDSAKGIDLPPQKRQVGYLFQQYALFPHMTVEQNIRAGARHLEKARRAQRVDELTAMLHLEGLEGLRPGQLSGGQQQRVALARILASEPRAILLDEPFSALDSSLTWQLELELYDVLGRFDGPVLWVSHDRGEVYRSCPQVCVLDRGRSAPVSGIRELMTDPVTVSAARLSGCKNYAPVERGAAPGTVSVPDWALTLHTARPWREGITTLGVRANHIRPAPPEAENAFSCDVVRVTEDVFTMLVMLRPRGSRPGAPLLRMELGKDQWAAEQDREEITVSVRPEHLMLLQD